MPTLERWLLATVIALLVGLWHAADTALRERAARKSFSTRIVAIAATGGRPVRFADGRGGFGRRVAPPDAGESPPGIHTRNR